MLLLSLANNSRLSATVDLRRIFDMYCIERVIVGWLPMTAMRYDVCNSGERMSV